MITTSHLDFKADWVTVNKLCRGFGIPCHVEPAEGVKRNLFGVGAENILAEQLTQQVLELATKSSEEWNFDFIQESPIPGGRYAWERIPECDVPVWYRSEGTPVKRRAEETRPLNVKKDFFNTSQVTTSSEKCSAATNRAKLLQTNIKGFSRVQKRRSSKHIRPKDMEVQGPKLVADYIIDKTVGHLSASKELRSS